MTYKCAYSAASGAANCLTCGKCCAGNFSILDDFQVNSFSVSGPRNGYGIAADIGTTTVVLALLDLTSAKIIARHSFMNPQRAYGPDVISRIHAANEGHLADLRRLITESIADGIDTLLKNSFIKKIDEIVIAGNTTMIHLLLGRSCGNLGVFPFKTDFTLEKKYLYADVFFSGSIRIDCSVKIIPWFAAFVGGDITAGLLYVLQNVTTLTAQLPKSDRSFLLIDLGTNGEMALYNKGKLIITSTAAGPAFENSARGHIVGASGVIHELAQLIRNEQIDETGLLKTAQGCFSQKEICDLQLAKSAVRTGLEILLDSACMTHNDIEIVCLAGGIGQAIDVSDAAAIGLIPQELVCKTLAIGNSSLGGAVRALLSPEDAEKDMQTLLSNFIEINLAEHPRFNDMFTENMFFIFCN